MPEIRFLKLKGLDGYLGPILDVINIYFDLRISEYNVCQGGSLDDVDHMSMKGRNGRIDIWKKRNVNGDVIKGSYWVRGLPKDMDYKLFRRAAPIICEGVRDGKYEYFRKLLLEQKRMEADKDRIMDTTRMDYSV
jgi:hypothetical protein